MSKKDLVEVEFEFAGCTWYCYVDIGCGTEFQIMQAEFWDGKKSIPLSKEELQELEDTFGPKIEELTFKRMEEEKEQDAMEAARRRQEDQEESKTPFVNTMMGFTKSK